MLKIYLARHGQDNDNVRGILNGHRDEPLTELGISQAGELAHNIKESGIKIDKIYSSPLNRTKKTAEIIAATLSLATPEIFPLLIERDFGVMTGHLVSEAVTMCKPDILKAELVTYILSPEGAETFPQLLERGRQVVKEIKAKHSDGNILLVTSGDIGKMIYADYYNLDWKNVLTMFHFGNSDLVLLAEDSPAEEAHVFKTKQYNH
ncbi:MAG: histidine phosphatase family protein [Patescibacteria group bacterium]